MNKKSGYYFALSAAASAAMAAAPGTAAAVCDCTLKGLAPTVIRTQGPETLAYRGSPSAGYDAHIVQDSLYGFTGGTAPRVWFDYEQQASGTYTTTAQLCRLDYTGVLIRCAVSATDTRTVTGSGAYEFPVPVVDAQNVPIWGTASPNSVWDLVRMHVVSPHSTFKPSNIPSAMDACW